MEAPESVHRLEIFRHGNVADLLVSLVSHSSTHQTSPFTLKKESFTETYALVQLLPGNDNETKEKHQITGFTGMQFILPLEAGERGLRETLQMLYPSDLRPLEPPGSSVVREKHK